MLEVFWRIYLNIIFWILLWMLTSLVIWNLNITLSTNLKYCYKLALNKKLKLITDGRGHKIFSEKATWPWNIWVYGLLGYDIFFEKFVKPYGPPSSPPPHPVPTYFRMLPKRMSSKYSIKCFNDQILFSHKLSPLSTI